MPKLRLVTLGIAASAFLLWSSCAKPTANTKSPFLNAIGTIGLTGPTAHADGVFARGSTSTLASLVGVKAAVESALNQTSADDCLKNAFSFPTPTLSVSTCLGPSLNYLNHPDGADGPACASGFPCYPIRQLGIVADSEIDGESCSTARANATVSLAADVTNTGMRAVAGILCASKLLGLRTPTAGGTPLELAAAVNKAVSDASFTSVSVSQLTPRTDAVSTWKTRIVGTLGTQKIGLTLVHSPLDAENKTYAGHLFGLVGDGSNNFAFSLTYRQTASAVTLVSRFGMPSAVTSDPFDVNNAVDFSHSLLSGEYVSYILAQLSPTTGNGTAYLAWMDSTNEPYSRVFQLTTAAGLSADTGLAYFGFGNPLTSSTDRGAIKKMLCNVNGPGADNSGLTGKAEAQRLTRNTSGVFTSSQSALTFAPTNNCAYTPGTLELGLDPSAPSPITAVVPNLVVFDGTTGVGAWGNIPVLSEPTY